MGRSFRWPYGTSSVPGAEESCPLWIAVFTSSAVKAELRYFRKAVSGMPGGRGVEVDRPGGAGIPVASYKEDQGNTGGGPVRGSFAMESTSVSLAAQEGEGFGSSPTDDQKFLWASAMSRGDWATAEPGPSLYTGRAVGCGRGGVSSRRRRASAIAF